MQRKPTKNTRGSNALEKRFQGWIKLRPCCWCGSESGSIVDHVKGATFRHNKVLIGHIFVLPNCVACDEKKTIQGKKLGDYATAWLTELADYGEHHKDDADNLAEEMMAIIDWRDTWQNGRL